MANGPKGVGVSLDSNQRVTFPMESVIKQLMTPSGIRASQ
jgi:hypothetical protein